VGTFGDIGTLSFYPAHHITMGEGGAVFTNNLELKQIAESFRDWEEIVIAHQEKTILVARDFVGSWVTCQKATTTNTHTAI